MNHTVPQRIDVHHHIIPPAFVAAMDAAGIKEVAGAPLPKWSPQQSIDVMDMNHIRTAITSLSAPGVFFGDVQKARSLARACNDFAAGIVQQYPGRFGNFAVLPMPFTDHACTEAVYALDMLKADGVVLLGSTEGKFLGDASFEELMAELNRRHTTVFIHPNLHASSMNLGLDMPGFLVEFLCDTTRAATNLILSGTVERYQNIRWILAHAGGFLPYIAWRVSLSNLMPQYAERAPQGFLTYVRRFYFDTALSPSPFALAALRELVDPSHILFGSDFPFAPAPVTALQTQQLESVSFLDAPTLQGINRDHALALFPRYALKNEAVSGVPPIAPEGLRSKLKRMAFKPVIAMADSARNR